jgi:hypothetical protein
MPAIMGHPYPYEFLLTPGKVTIVSEAYMQVRHIYTDGRPLPADPDPTFNGTSIGRWDGDTLVVETIGFSPLTTIARNTPHSDKMRIVERFRLDRPGHDVGRNDRDRSGGIGEAVDDDEDAGAASGLDDSGVHLRRKQSQLPRRPGERPV